MSYTHRTHLHRFRKKFAGVNRLNKVEPQMMNLYITYSSDILLFPEIVQYITNFVTPLGLGYIEASLYTVISRKVVGKNVHVTIPKGNMGYDQYTVHNDSSCRTYFCCFPLTLANIRPWPPVPFFQIS